MRVEERLPFCSSRCMYIGALHRKFLIWGLLTAKLSSYIVSVKTVRLVLVDPGQVQKELGPRQLSSEDLVRMHRYVFLKPNPGSSEKKSRNAPKSFSNARQRSA